MKLCESVNWCRIGWLIVVLNLLLIPNFTYSQNLPPVLNIGLTNQHAEVEDYFSYTIPSNAFKDENNDAISYTVTGLPSELTYTESSRLISGTPINAGTYTISVTATDESNATNTTSFKIFIHTGDNYAAFTMDYQMGCKYRRVQFTNLSKNASTYEWTLGNGNEPFSNVYNPSAVYDKPGSYTVSLTIDQGLATENTFSDVINIYPRPKPNIGDINNPGCELADVTLQSTGGAVTEPSRTVNGQVIGAISSGTEAYHYWFFFDDHEEVYNTNPPAPLTATDFEGAIYNVVLEVTDENGCQGSKTNFNLFEVDDKPEAAFTINKADDCGPSLTTFTDNSSVINSTISDYNWTVNGTALDEHTKSVDFDFSTLGAGNYDVSLTSISEKGCASAAHTETVRFNNNNTADFSTNAYYCSGDTVALNALTSSGVTAYEWDINNDGSVESTDPNYNHLFSSAGNFPVKLTVHFDDDCQIETTHTVNVDEAIADFSYSSFYNCTDNNYPVFFSSTSKTVLGRTISATNWYHTTGGTDVLISTSPSFNYTFSGSGSHSIRLDVVSEDGCTASYSDDIVLKKPSLSINISGTTSGCLPAGATNFQAVFNSDFETPNTYNWTFGDGNTASGENVSNTYATSGSFNVTLVVNTSSGCTYTETRNSAVQVTSQPTINSVNIIQDPLNCFSLGVQLNVDYSAGTELLTFDTPSGQVQESLSGNPHAFNYEFPDTGSFTIDVMATRFGCTSTPFSVTNILANEPRAFFNPDQNTFCTPPYNVSFDNRSSYSDPLTTFSWDFGDGNSSTDPSPSHLYATTGNYNVTLTVDNGTCSHQYSEEINIFNFDNATGIIGATDNTGCAPLTVSFTEDITNRLSSNYPINKLLWDYNNDGIIDDSTNAGDPVIYTYTTPGEYDVHLEVISSSGCNYSFTESNLVSASGPISSFSHSPALVCLGTSVDFNNTSTQPSFDTATITGYLWNFGDGTESTQENPTHSFNSDTTFSVSLTVNDSQGCSTTLEKTNLIELIPFEPLFEASDSLVCNNTAITFSNNSTGAISEYRWDFDGNGSIDLTSTNTDAVSHTYTSPGNYNVTLEVAIANGCTKTYVETIRVINSTANFTATATNIGCAPAFAHFTPATNDSDVLSYSWNFGDGNSSTERAPRNYYVSPGDYTVSLTINFKGDCSESLTRTEYITAEGANGDFSYDKTIGCAPNAVLFSVSNMRNVDYITWDYGAGFTKIDTLPTGTTSYFESDTTYTELGFNFPSVILTDEVCGEYAYDNAYLGSIYTSTPPVVNFGVDNDSICKGVEIQFTDSSVSNDPENALSSWKWDFGTVFNDTSVVQHPKFAYQMQGVYSPQLIVSNTLGCTDTLQKDDYIYIYGNDQLSARFIIDDSLACAWQELNFTSIADAGTGTIVSYEWDFGDGTNAANTMQTHTYHDSLKGQTINVIHRVTDDKFCIDSTLRTVEIDNLQAAFGYDPQPVYRGSLVDFEDQSSNDFGPNPNGWNWSFENGSPSSSAIEDPQDIDFSSIGIDNKIQLIVTNNNTCSDTTFLLVDVLNNPPVVDTFTITSIENSTYFFRIFEFEDRFSDEDPGHTMNAVRIETSPANGSFRLNGSAYTIGTSIPYSQITQLEFVPDANWNGSTEFIWNAFDGFDWSLSPELIYVVVLEEPEPPKLLNITFDLPEDSVIQITEQDFIDHINYSVGSLFEFDSLWILSDLTPAVGTLTFNGNAFSAPQLILENQINNSDTVFKYYPTQGYNGTLSFNWNAHDGYNFAETAGQVIINYYNTAPTLTNIVRLDLKEDDFQTITKSEFEDHYFDIDQYDSPQVFFLSNIPLANEGKFWINGQEVGPNDFSISYDELINFRFDPAWGFEGTTQVNWGISDGVDTSFALIQFEFVNTPPYLHDVNVDGFEDEVFTFDVSNFNPSTQPSTTPFEDDDHWDQLEMIEIVSLPQHGELLYDGFSVSPDLTINRGNINLLTYLSANNWNGSDQFDYNAFDGTDWANNDTLVYLNIQPVNDAPTPSTVYYSIQEDEVLTGKNVGDNDKDIDDNHSVLRFSVAEIDSASAGENGTITLNNLGYLTYTPNKDFNGFVYFIYTVCDDDNACAKDSVFITIEPINDAPVAAIDSFYIYEDEDPKTFDCLFNDVDIDGDNISLNTVESSYTRNITTEYGELEWNPYGNITFTLNSGLDTLKAGDEIPLSFNYKIRDVHNLQDSSVFVITILGRNDAPIAVADSYATIEGEASISSDGTDEFSILYNDSDPENDQISVATVNNNTLHNITSPFGTFNWQTDGSWIFTQNLDATDSLYQDELVQIEYPYTNSDGVTESDTSTISFSITGVNDAPIAENNYLNISEDTESISITISQVEALLLNDSDVDGDDFWVNEIEGSSTKSTTSDVGTLNWDSDGSYTYIPDPDIVDQLAGGTSIDDTFNYSIVDDFGATDTAQLIITITGVNDEPFANDDYISIYEDTQVTVVDSANGLLPNDGDVDQDPIVVAVNGVGSRTLNGEYGTLTWDSTGAYTYITDPNLVDTLYYNENVIDVFTYTVNDPSGETDFANLYITIIGENDAPVAENHYESMYEEDIVLVLNDRNAGIISEDSDIDDNENFEIKQINNSTIIPAIGTYGSLVWHEDGTFIYTLNQLTDSLAEYEVVVDSFLYLIEDAFDSTATAWFYIEITGENDQPEASRDTLELTENDIEISPAWSLLLNDADTDGDFIELYSFSYDTTSPTETTFASFDWDSTGYFTYNRYTYNRIYNGLDTLAFDDLIVDSISYSIIDEHGVESESKLHLQIQGVNDAPTTGRDANFINESSTQVSSNANNFILENDYDVDRRDSIVLLNINEITSDSVAGVFGYLKWTYDGNYTYYNNYEATDSLYRSERVHDLFPYTITDLQGATTTDTLDITISGVNDKPVALNDTIFISEDDDSISIHPLNEGLLWNDYDVDGDRIFILITGTDTIKTLNGKYGLLTIYENGQAQYKLNAQMDSLYSGEKVFETFSYTIVDEHNYTSNALILITITGDNDKPEAVDDFVSILEDTDSIFAPIEDVNALLFHDYDVDNDMLMVSTVSDTSLIPAFGNYGELYWDSTGAYTYITDKSRADQLAEGDTAYDTFTYLVRDPFDGLDSAQLLIELIGVNDPPVAMSNFYSTFEFNAISITTDSTNDILDNDFDVDGDTSLITLINNLPNDTIIGEWGTLIWMPDGSFEYFPDSALALALRPDEVSNDIFEYTLEDEFGATDTSIINFSILGINNAPIADNDTLIIYEDEQSKALENSLIFRDYDVDNDTLFVSKIEDDTTGVFTGLYGEVFWNSKGDVVFTPNRQVIDQLGARENAIEEYEYTIVDEGGLRDTAILRILIIGENDPIIARNDYDTIYEDRYSIVNVVENDEDLDNNENGNFDYNSLNIQIQPINGEASVNSANGEIYYFPNENYFGTDSLLYQICDKGDPVYCDTAWLVIDVHEVNDPPVATHLNLQTDVNIPVDFNAFDQVVDIDDGIDPASLDFPEGNLSISDSIFTYMPDSFFIGRDEFIYSLADYSDERAYVIVTVSIPDDGDGAQNDFATTSENTAIQINILANDTLNNFVANPLSVDIRIYAKHGIASYDPFNHVIDYEPANNFNGIDSLTYLVESKTGTWDFATVYITVEPINSPIIANDDATTTFMNKTKFIQILLNDIDIDNGIDYWSVDTLQGTQNGSISYDTINGVITYIPDLDYLGEDYFSYRVCDLDEDNTSCDTANVFLLVKSKTDGINAGNDEISTKEDSTITITYEFITANDEVFTGVLDPTSLFVITGPQHGTFESDGAYGIIYTPFDNYFGPDWITYQVCDTVGNCDFAEINIWINEVNTAPIANDDNFVVTENTKKRLSILSNDFDYDGNLDWSTLDTITGPSKGTIVIDTLTGTILYTPSINADIDEFKYRICDNEGLCAEATVMVLVDLGSTIPYNQVTEEDTPDTIDLAPLLAKFNFLETVDSYIGNGGPIVGNWEFINNNTQLVYTPLHDSIGADYYNIQLYFPNSDTADLIVIVDILPVNDAPVAVLDSVTWTTDTDKLIIDFNTILSNDFDVDGDSIFLSQGVIEFGDSLHVVFNSDSTITVTADTILWCDSWFTYEITDPSGESDTGYVFIMPELEGIVAEDDSIEVDENSQITIHELLNDSFKDMQLCTIDTVVILSDPLNGIAASNEQNTIEYRPTDHYYGADSLEYEIVDIWGQTDSAWVLINVIQRNQPPVADPDAVTNDFGESIQIFILENDYDPDPDGYIDTIFTNLVYDNLPSNGTVWFNPDSGYFEYTPIEFTCEADQFSYTIFDNEGDSASTTVSIGLPEEAPLFANNDTVKTWPGVPVEFNVLTNDEGYFLPYINNYTEPEWGSIEQIGDSSFIFNPYADFGSNDSMTYELVSPCGNQTNGKVIFMIEELRVPEIITPNNDTKNDVLIIDGIEYFPNAMLQIFNRYGHVVFQSKGYENNWGGYSNQGSLGGNKPLPTGSYYYTLLYNEGRNKQAGLIYIYR